MAGAQQVGAEAGPDLGVLQRQFDVGFQEAFLAAAVVALAFVAIGEYLLAAQQARRCRRSAGSRHPRHAAGWRSRGTRPASGCSGPPRPGSTARFPGPAFRRCALMSSSRSLTGGRHRRCRSGACARAGTSCTAMIDARHSLNCSTICCSTGGLPTIRSSASSTANGSLPTRRWPHSTAWPNPAPAPGARSALHVVRLDAAYHTQQLILARLFQGYLQFEGHVKVILDRSFVATCHKDHLPHARGIRFFHRILDERLVHHRQHFFGLRLGGGQETVPRPATGKIAFLTNME